VIVDSLDIVPVLRERAAEGIEIVRNSAQIIGLSAKVVREREKRLRPKDAETHCVGEAGRRRGRIAARCGGVIRGLPGTLEARVEAAKRVGDGLESLARLSNGTNGSVDLCDPAPSTHERGNDEQKAQRAVEHEADRDAPNGYGGKNELTQMTSHRGAEPISARTPSREKSDKEITMPRITAALILALAVLAGCAPAASTATGSPTATASSSLATFTATASVTASASATGVRADACTLARSDVETVIGPVTSQQAQTTSVPGTTATMNVGACAFTSSDGLLTFAITRAQVSRTDFDNSVKQIPGVQTESGIGDAAYSGTVSAAGAGVTMLFVLKGSTYFTLQATSRSKDGTALLTALRPVAQKVAGTL
jgi:hypothetical protein